MARFMESATATSFAGAAAFAAASAVLVPAAVCGPSLFSNDATSRRTDCM